MANVTIKAQKNGPYEVSGGAKLFDHQGKGIRKISWTLCISAAAATRRANRSATAVTKKSVLSEKNWRISF